MVVTPYSKGNIPRLFDLAVNKECTVAEVESEGWGEGGRGWVWRRRLLAWEEESVRECSLLLHNFVLQVNVFDSWRWTLGTTHEYSVREAYRFITTTGAEVNRSLVDNVWHKHIPSKVSLFVWRLLRNRLPTRDNLLRRNIIQDQGSVCVAGCEALETARHLFLLCTTSSLLWSYVLKWLGLVSVFSLDLRDHHLQFCSMAGLPRSTHSYLQGIWYACVWVIWKDRNDRIFQNAASHPYVLFEKIKFNSFVWMKAKLSSFIYSYYDWATHPLLCMGVRH
jgi:hypothetical protein